MCLVYFLGIAAYLEMPANVAVQALARSASEAEREGRVACNRGLCGLWPEKTELARLAVNRLTERSRAAVPRRLNTSF